MAMAGMGASAGQAGSFPALALLLALFMAGYIVWTTDRLTSQARARTAAANPGITQTHQPQVTLAAAPSRPSPAGPPATPDVTGTRHQNPAGRPTLAPKLAACCKIAMSIAMGYMLILML